MLITYNSGAGVVTDYAEEGDFFRLMQTAGPVTVYFLAKGREIARAEGVSGGYAERFAEAFDKVRIESATAQQIQFVIRRGNQVFYDQPPQGLVIIQNVNGAFSQAQKTVTNASGQLLAANAGRRYLMVQNNDSGGDIYVTVSGADATTANGLKVPAGGALELAGFVPTGAIKAIGSIANNPNIIVVEG